MQFWKGQHIVFQGMLGTVQQDQGLDKLVRITLDHTDSLEYAVNPKKLYVQSQEGVAAFDYFVGRQYLP